VGYSFFYGGLTMEKGDKIDMKTDTH
jgi:hypothetical protein